MTPLPKPRVLVVDDDKAVRESLRRSLEFNGYDVHLAGDGAEALATIGGADPDVVVMDVMMPRLDGIEATKALRAAGHDVPVLVLTARDAVGDRVEGLDAGADDYLTKPFALAELLARLRAALRRAAAVEPKEAMARVLRAGPLEVDLVRRLARVNGNVLRLTPREWDLLVALARSPGRVVTHRQLQAGAWGIAHPEDAQQLRVYVGRLRQKLGAAAGLLRTEPGVGYRFGGDEEGPPGT